MSSLGISVPRTFFERARREADRYGDDPWIFLRELVQNSRDAGARHIRFTTRRDDAHEVVICDDDGSGMSRSDVERYLLRLYASRKAAETAVEGRPDDAVGKFGVGFWSVLRFGPSLIRVSSRCGDVALALEVDCVNQTIREVPGRRDRPGTEVTLLRPATPEHDGASFKERVRRGLVRYAGHVRGVSGASPPRLTLDGESLNRELAPRGFIAEAIKGPGFSGVLGLGSRPRVRLYAHGLMVKEVASLEELLPRRAQQKLASTPGLYPQVEINADGLEVLLDRQAVVEDKLLESLVATCERRVGRLKRRLLDRLAPLPLLRRAWLLVNQPRRLVAALAVLGVLVSAGAAGAALVQLGRTDSPTSSAAAPFGVTTRSVQDALDPAAGPVINTPEDVGQSPPWDIRYRGPDDPFIKIATLSRYDVDKGLVARELKLTDSYAWVADSRHGYWVEVGLAPSTRPFVLPMPTGQGLVAGMIFVDDQPLRGRRGWRIEEGPHEQAVLVRARQEGGRLRYRTAPRHAPQPPRAPYVPDDLPAEIRAQVRATEGVSVDDRVDELARWVESRLRYTTSAVDAAVFQAADRPWLDKVLRFSKGDCDVMNGLLVVTLRAAGIPARLGVGFVGDSGRVATDLHAWTEYWDGDNWQVIDASPPRAVPQVEASLASAWPPLGDERAPRARRSAALAAEPPAFAPTVQANEEAPRGGNLLALRWVLGVLFVLALSVLAVSLTLLWRRRSGRSTHDDVDDQVAVALLDHFLREGGGADPLHLKHRPFFGTLQGTRLTLAQLEALARQGRLVASYANNPLLRGLARDLPVLDREDPRVAPFLERLPAVRVLEDLLGSLRRGADHPALEDAERTLSRIDTEVRIHAEPDGADIDEVVLPVRPRGPLPPRHLVIGLNDPSVRDALELWATDRPLARFRLMSTLLERSTLYLDARATLLGELAREAL